MPQIFCEWPPMTLLPPSGQEHATCQKNRKGAARPLAAPLSPGLIASARLAGPSVSGLHSSLVGIDAAGRAASSRFRSARTASGESGNNCVAPGVVSGRMAGRRIVPSMCFIWHQSALKIAGKCQKTLPLWNSIPSGLATQRNEPHLGSEAQKSGCAAKPGT